MIIWGIRIGRKFMGYAADYCPSCREPAVMRVMQVLKHAHLYFVPMTLRKPIHYEAICHSCGTVVGRKLDAYSCFTPDADLEGALRRGTTPGFDELLDRCASSEERALADSALPQERMLYIRDVIISLDYMAVLRSGWTWRHYLRASLRIFILVFILPAVMMGVTLALNLPQKYELMIFAVIIVLLTIMICRIVFKNHGVYSHAIRERLIHGLAPIEPTVEELCVVLKQLKSCTLAKSIDAADLVTGINERLSMRDSI